MIIKADGVVVYGKAKSVVSWPEIVAARGRKRGRRLELVEKRCCLTQKRGTDFETVPLAAGEMVARFRRIR